MKRLSVFIVLVVCGWISLQAKSYYFNGESGNDLNSGLSPESPFRSLEKINELMLQPGDSVLLSAGQTFKEPLILSGLNGTAESEISITSYGEKASDEKAVIDAAGFLNGLLMQDCAHVKVTNLE